VLTAGASYAVGVAALPLPVTHCQYSAAPIYVAPGGDAFSFTAQ
jgi:hypothetical protein